MFNHHDSRLHDAGSYRQRRRYVLIFSNYLFAKQYVLINGSKFYIEGSPLYWLLFVLRYVCRIANVFLYLLDWLMVVKLWFRFVIFFVFLLLQ